MASARAPALGREQRQGHDAAQADEAAAKALDHQVDRSTVQRRVGAEQLDEVCAESVGAAEPFGGFAGGKGNAVGRCGKADVLDGAEFAAIGGRSRLEFAGLLVLHQSRLEFCPGFDSMIQPVERAWRALKEDLADAPAPDQRERISSRKKDIQGAVALRQCCFTHLHYDEPGRLAVAAQGCGGIADTLTHRGLVT